jgi:hypothetical protein
VPHVALPCGGKTRNTQERDPRCKSVAPTTTSMLPRASTRRPPSALRRNNRPELRNNSEIKKLEPRWNARRINTVYRALHSPAHDHGSRAKLFFFAMCMAAATSNMLSSLLGGVLLFLLQVAVQYGKTGLCLESCEPRGGRRIGHVPTVAPDRQRRYTDPRKRTV